MESEQKFARSFEKKIGYHISWWIAFFLIFIVVGAATAGLIYTIFSEVLPIIATLPTFAPFIAQYVLPVVSLPGVSLIVQVFTHSAFLFSFIMWGRLYFNDAFKLLQRLFSSKQEIFKNDLNKLLKDLIFTDLEDKEGKDVSKSAVHRLQHIEQGLLKHAALLADRLTTRLNALHEDANINNTLIIEVEQIFALKIVITKIEDEWNSIPYNADFVTRDSETRFYDILDSFTEEKKISEILMEFTKDTAENLKKEKQKNGPVTVRTLKNTCKNPNFKIHFKSYNPPGKTNSDGLNRKKKKKDSEESFIKTSEKPRFWNWFSSMFFALAVAGFNFTANLTAGILLLNINQITNLQAIQATVLQNFLHLGAFAQGLGILGGAVTALVLVPFLLNFIKKGLKQRNARTRIKTLDYDSDDEESEITIGTLLKDSKPTNIKKSALIYTYEVICVINSFLVNSFGIAFGTLAILSTALSAISPGLQLSFPWVISIAAVSCLAGALAAMTMTREKTMNSIKTLFDKPVQIPSKKTQKQEAKWYAKIPRLFTTLANIIVLCGFTLSPTSYLSVLFGASDYVRLVIATILIPCIWSLTNKIFKGDDLKIQQGIDSASSSVLKTFSVQKTIKPTTPHLWSQHPETTVKHH